MLTEFTKLMSICLLMKVNYYNVLVPVLRSRGRQFYYNPLTALITAELLHFIV